MKISVISLCRILLAIVVCYWGFVLPLNAQPNSVSGASKASPKTTFIFKKVEDTLKKQFEKSSCKWPPEAMYLRSFKYDRELEVWIRNTGEEKFQLFKTYRVCMQSGAMGPKRMEGDYQVPEGFYYIDEFNPNSMYHLALGLNYPNASDRILSDSRRPGGNIFIHGNCVSTGCIPIMDGPMEELYVLASYIKNEGEQEFIPVHVFPIKYNVKKSQEYLESAMNVNPDLKTFNEPLRDAFHYFEVHKSIPIVLINRDGSYLVSGK